MQTQSLVANIKVPKFILQTQKSLNCTGLHFSNARSLAVTTHKEPLRQGFVNISSKSVPSSPDKIGVQALSDFWVMLECVVFYGYGSVGIGPSRFSRTGLFSKAGRRLVAHCGK